MAATWNPVDAEIWACSLAFERYTANRPILDETKTINTVAGERLVVVLWMCTCNSFRDERRILPLTLPLLYSEPRLGPGTRSRFRRDDL